MPVLLFCFPGCSGDASASVRSARAVENRARASAVPVGRREELSLRLFIANDIVVSDVERRSASAARRFPSGVEADSTPSLQLPFCIC